MIVSHCLEIVVQQKDQAVIIARTNGPTSCRYLRVEKYDDTLMIRFCDKDGAVRKEINYNYQHVVKYTCEGWVDPVKVAAS